MTNVPRITKRKEFTREREREREREIPRIVISIPSTSRNLASSDFRPENRSFVTREDELVRGGTRTSTENSDRGGFVG